MPSNEVDELYVTLKFREELGEAVDDIDDKVDDLKRSFSRSMSSAEDDVEETADEVSALRKRLEVLDGKTVEIDADLDDADVRAGLASLTKSRDVDVDRSGGIVGGGKERLPGALDEVGYTLDLFGRLNPKLQASIVGFTALTGAVLAFPAAIVGATAAATAAAAQFGSVDVRSDLRRLTDSARGVAAELADQFTPIIQNTVIPALRGLAAIVQNGVIPDLRQLATGVAEPLIQKLGGELLEKVAVFIGALQMMKTALVEAADFINTPLTDESDPTNPNMGERERVQFDSQPTSTQLKGAYRRIRNETLQPALNEARAIINLIQKGEKGASSGLQEIESLRSQLLLTLETIEENPARVYPEERLQEDLKNLQLIIRQAEQLQSGGGEKPSIPDPDVVQPENQIAGERSRFAPNLNLPSSTQIIRRQLRQINPLLQRTGRIAGQVGKSLVGAFTTFGDKIISLQERLKRFGKSLLRIFSRVASRIASAAVQAAVLAPLTSTGGFGGVFTSILGLAEGGIVTSPTMAMVGEGGESEAVLPLSRLEGMMGGKNIQVTIQGQTRTEGSTLRTSFRQAEQESSILGHHG